MADAVNRTSIARRHLIVGSAAVMASGVIGHVNAQGTPVAGDDTGPERLASLLSLVPASFAEVAGFTWSDSVSQAASVGVEMPTGLPQEISAEFVGAVSILPVDFSEPGPPLEPAAHEHFGFSAVTAHQELRIPGGSFGLKLLRGGLPLTDLPTFWESVAYERETTREGIDIWSIPGVPNTSGSGPNMGRPPTWHFAILDETLVMGRSFEEPDSSADVVGQIAMIVTQATTGGKSILDVGGYDSLVSSLLPETVAVLAVPGTQLAIENFRILPANGEDDGTSRRLIEDDPNQVPPVLGVVFAITGGSVGQGFAFGNAPGTPGASPVPSTMPDPGDAIVQANLGFASAGEAMQAITTIETRWNSWESVSLEVPYADLLALESARSVASDPTIAAFGFRPIDTPYNWLYIFLNGDVLPFTYLSSTPSATPLA